MSYCPECESLFAPPPSPEARRCPICGTAGVEPPLRLQPAAVDPSKRAPPVAVGLLDKLRPVAVDPARGLDPEIRLVVGGIAGELQCTQASFGPVLPAAGVRAPLHVAEPFTCDGDESLPASARGRIVLCGRGGSAFADKARVAQAAGAVALIVAQSNPGAWPFTPTCRAGGPGVLIPVVAIPHDAGQRLRQHVSVPRPLDADARIVATLARGEGSRACAICTEALLDNVVALPCLHVFHQACLLPWLAGGKTTCPNCRFDLADKPAALASNAVDGVQLGWFG